jgi:hypothetical protein
MIGQGVAREVISLINGRKGKKMAYDKGDLYLGGNSTKRLFAEMEQSCYTIPSIFHGSFKQPFGTHTTRAVDWLDIIRYVIPTLFVPSYKDSCTKDALLAITTVVQIALQTDITDSLLEELER